ncbi:galectin-4-like isoform X2 [Dendropsophus ebraccatus]|uniref:galectin-4-like isoform X2 n=1 Tax=Dendropsophus ebraccatus TaxID=150705 RepID=UPI003831565C
MLPAYPYAPGLPSNLGEILPEPYEALLRRPSFKKTENIILEGYIPEGAQRFRVNLMNSISQDILFHASVRLNEKRIVRNSKKHGNWGKEESDTPNMPFEAGQNFTMEIRNGEKTIEVYGDLEKLFDFHHREFIKLYDTIEVVGDVNLTCMDF